MATNNNNKALNVPHLRFPEFSGEWNKCTINDLATVVGGGTPDTTVKSYWGGDIQWFTPSEIGKNKYVDFSLRTITRDGLAITITHYIIKFSCHGRRMFYCIK